MILALAVPACEKDQTPPPVVPPNPGEEFSGGATTVFGTFSSLFEQPAPNMDAGEVLFHNEGDAAFEAAFVTAPAPVNQGLGPLFNSTSCADCHKSNGRSAFPASSADLDGLLIRISLPGAGTHGEPLTVPGYGEQLQHRAIFNGMPEANVNFSFEEETRQLAGGETVTLRKPVFSLTNPYDGALPPGLMMSPRIASAVIGLGLLEAIAESDLLSRADPADANGDGISGKPNNVWDEVSQQTALGRFGWKAGQPHLLQQAAMAYVQDMGITSSLFPNENCQGMPQCDSLDDDPEINQATLTAVAFYCQSLGVPARRNLDNSQVQQGKQLFLDAKCESCHRNSFTTGQHPDGFNFLSNQKIFPYTDLLLHDMGEGLADYRPEFDADGQEWRTPPLWGIGLTPLINGHSNFLHDGRARSLLEAVLWHGGEAEASRQKVEEMSKAEREALIEFLESL